MDSRKSDKTSADDDKVKSDLFNLVEKLRIELNVKDHELQVKDEELTKEKEAKQRLSVRANRADKLETDLTRLHGTNAALQKSLWKSFPSESFNYYIKVKVPSASDSNENVQYRYLYVDKSGQLRLDDRPWLMNRSQFVFTKNSNGSFTIYSLTKNQYLRTQTSLYFSRVIFSATDEDSAEEFVLFFHQQNQQAGLSVDISSLAGIFLHMDNTNFVVANSSNAPDDKFLIVPVDEDDWQ